MYLAAVKKCSRGGALALAALSGLLLTTAAQARAQTETVLYSFCAQPNCTDGQHPFAGVILDAQGNLYGTTYVGGANALGTVFEVSPSGTETVLYSFCSQLNCKDGYHPEEGVIFGSNGLLYGATYDGGAHNGGTVFEISPGGIETVIYAFCVLKGCKDGYYPHADLAMDKTGNLYGTTQFNGAHNGGVVFEVTPSGVESVLYSFCALPNCTDGYHPLAGVVLDGAGNVYGTTYQGGAHGQGALFAVTPSGTETVLYSFCGKSNCTDGSHPRANLLLDAQGNLYGTTYDGGANGGGTVFEVSASGIETVLYSFCAQRACKDGTHPRAGLITDANGNSYGTTYGGGAKGHGTVFELSPSGTETVLHSFSANGADGYYPYAGLVMDSKGNLYGTTYGGGTHAGGTVFEVVP